jgi:hypothetical protein
MLQTIEVEIDAQGGIHPLQALPEKAGRRGLLTLEVPEHALAARGRSADWHRFVGRLVDSPNFNVDPVELQRKLRDEWS